MAGNKRKNIVWLIPENETRDSHTYHYSVVKTKNTIAEKFRFKKSLLCRVLCNSI